MHSNHHRPRRLAAIAAASLALTAGAVLLIAGPAAAHVHVDGDAVVGERADVTVRIPTESDTASTTSLTVTLPLDTPITSVRAQSKPGWTVEITHVDLDTPVVVGDVSVASTIGSVTWTATGPGVAPGEFDDFVVQLGPIPDVDELVLPTTQGYSDGTVVEWSELSEGGVEPEHPAPVLAISPATEDGASDHGDDHGSEEPVETPEEGQVVDQPAQTAAIAGLALGAFGVVVAIVAIVIAIAAVRRTRS
jgi:uncharacterized protein YcnI